MRYAVVKQFCQYARASALLLCGLLTACAVGDADEYQFTETPMSSEWRAFAAERGGAACVWDGHVGRTTAGSLAIKVAEDAAAVGWPHWRHARTPVETLELWRVTAFVKTENVRDGHGAYIGLVCPAPGAGGDRETDRLAQADSSPVTGTTGWTMASEKILVPPRATQIDVLLLLHGRGTAWFDDVRIERVSEGPGPVPKEITASLRSDKVIEHDLWGFGFEDDPFFYNDENRQRGVDAAAIELHVERIKALRPGWVRCFVWWEAVNPSRDLETVDLSSDNGQSLLRTLETYQGLDVPVVLCGVEWGWPPEQVPFAPNNAARGGRFFTKLVRELREKHGLTCVKYLTITNEPDLHWEQRIGAFDTFVTAHRSLAEALQDEGLAEEVKIVGADVTVQQDFFDKAVAQTDAYCAAWSRHKYVKESQAALFRDVVRSAVSSTRENDRDGRREPVLCAEFGFHWPGTTDQHHTGIREHGYGLLTAMAACDMLDCGAAGGAIWCLCRQMYPGFNFMDYGLWEYADAGWKVRPVALAYSLFTRFVRPGDDSVELALDPEHAFVRGAAVARDGVPVGVFLVNLSESDVRVRFAGVPEDSRWNRFEYRPDRPLKSQDVLLLPSVSVVPPMELDLAARGAIALIRLVE
jgi:hypothetical protein